MLLLFLYALWFLFPWMFLVAHVHRFDLIISLSFLRILLTNLVWISTIWYYIEDTSFHCTSQKLQREVLLCINHFHLHHKFKKISLLFINNQITQKCYHLKYFWANYFQIKNKYHIYNNFYFKIHLIFLERKMNQYFNN